MAKSRLCSIPDCGKPARGRGWCSAHYERWYDHGDPLAPMHGTPKGELPRYFEEVVLTYEGDDCLIWPYGRSFYGYALMNLARRSHHVSRVLCKRVHGEPPTPRHHAAHSCGKGHEGCVAKKHLSWKTPKENAADRHIHGTARHGESHGKSTLRAVEVLEIRALSGTMSMSAIARRFGVDPTAVSRIISRQRWTRI